MRLIGEFEVVRVVEIEEPKSAEEFGLYEKIQLGGGTGFYIVEPIINGSRYFALVPVNRAYVQGIIVLNSEHISKIIKTLVDGLEKDFGNQ